MNDFLGYNGTNLARIFARIVSANVLYFQIVAT